nr:bacteriohemerythrin [Desulfovibrio sp. Huiquan2017]
MHWKKSLAVGFEQIDEEHKKLIAIINKAYDSAVDLRELEVLSEIVRDMRSYGAIHFSTEERLMRLHGYPGIKAHRALHDDFIVAAALADKLLSEGGTADPLGLFRFLADWLNHHILVEDKRLADYIIEKGAPASAIAQEKDSPQG